MTPIHSLQIEWGEEECLGVSVFDFNGERIVRIHDMIPRLLGARTVEQRFTVATGEPVEALLERILSAAQVVIRQPLKVIHREKERAFSALS